MRIVTDDQSLTSYEVAGLNAVCNLADGHAKLQPALDEFDLFPWPEIFRDSPYRFERSFLELFSAVTAESMTLDTVVMFPSASLGIDAVAKFLAESGRRRVGLLHPTFDNLYLLLRRAGLEVSPVAETEHAIMQAAESMDAVFLVSPNNPTGWQPHPELWPRLARSISSGRRRVIIDRTFRFLGQDDRQLSEFARMPGVMTVEDTGKTWSTAECKVAFVATSDRLDRDLINQIAEEITLNVSPVSLALCQRAMQREWAGSRLKRAVADNFKVLDRPLAELGFAIAAPTLSFLWLTVPHELFDDGPSCVAALAERGLATLPGNKFYWAEEELGHRRLRMSLARSTTVAKAAAQILGEFAGGSA